MGTLIWLVPAGIAWAVAVRFFWRAGAWLPYFVIGAAGMAFLTVFLLRDVVPGETGLRVATAASVDRIAWLFGIHTRVVGGAPGELLVLGVPYHNEWTQLSIGIECSGLLELAALAGLVAFFPALAWRRRLGVLLAALALSFAANVVRMLVIVGALSFAGQDALDIAHLVLGRLVFFVLTIGIYWFAITRPTLAVVGRRLDEGA